MAHFDPATLHFLQDLTRNNDREWFNSHKDRYTRAHDDAKGFLAALHAAMNQVDDIQGTKLWRIYRDVRFSKDKTPYNPRFGMSLSRRKPDLRGGYFLNIRPDGADIAAGFWGPNKGDLARIRAHIDTDGARFRAAAGNPQTVEVFGPMWGDSLKSAPRGYPKDHPSIDLLRYKQFLFDRKFTAAEVTGEDFHRLVVMTWLSARPFFDYMSEILTQDTDGRPVT
ncbi:MAG: DUF2461 domain-containing protein [Rhodothermales bacterium]|nr:DUF2461 domain-containing protein [Rhodothermales bacterium]MBO6779433.1 DUF2461 domain-containing protein [Rhodothermales bacterium]